MVRRFELLSAAAIAGALAWTAAPAIAQEPTAAEAQPAPAAEQQLGGIEEIVVTARRKTENQQDVPLSVSALTGDELTFNSVQDVQDIEKSVPGIQIRVFGARTSTAGITMRGQTAGSDVATVDGAVGVYINEVYNAREKGLNQALFDIESVQVLRGPQGLLFGRNTTGGALLINTAKPEEDFGGYLKLLSGDYSRYGGEGAINVPFNEELAARLAFSVVRRNGYSPRCVAYSPVFAIPPATPNSFLTFPDGGQSVGGSCNGKRQDIDDENGNSWRLTFQWTPSDFFTSTFVHDGNIQNTNGTASFIANVRAAPITASNANFLMGGVLVDEEDATEDRLDNRWTASERKQRGRIENYGLQWNNEVDLDTATAKLILGYRHVEVLEDFDLDGTAQWVLFTEQFFDNDQFSAELLFDGAAFDERLDWTAGVYFFNESGTDGSFSPILRGFPAFTKFDADYDHKSYSGYLNAVYHLTDTLNFQAGYRYTIDVRDMVARHQRWGYDANSDGVADIADPVGAPPPPFPLAAPGATPRVVFDCNLFADDAQTTRFPLGSCFKDVDKTFDAHTGQVGVQWQPTDSFQTYFNARRGYRSGGHNLRAQTPSQFIPFNEEYVTDLELGAKTDFELGTVPMRVNVALFYDMYDDAQRSLIKLTSGGNLQTVILNAAEATIWGWELELRANPMPDLELRFGSAAAIARYDEFLEDIDTDPVSPGIQPFDRSDQHFTNQPDYTVNASARYTLPIENLFGRASGDIALQLDWVWYDDTLLSGPQGPGLSDNEQSAYHIVDMRVDWSGVLDSPFDVSFWVKNLADKRYAVGAVNFQNSFGFDVLQYGAPRLFGADITYRF
jgi:iron complex outermembrane receptor protein